MKPSFVGPRASGAAGPASGEADAEGASASSGRGKGKRTEGTTTPRGARQPSDNKVMRSALRILKLRLDRVGRKLSELDFDNRALMGRVQFFLSENRKLHQALEKERVKLRNSPDRNSGAGPSTSGTHGVARPGSPTDASPSAGAVLAAGPQGSPSGIASASGLGPTVIEQDTWQLCPSAPGRSNLLADMMTPSTSSASLDAILGPRRQLRRMQQEQQARPEQHPIIALASTISPPMSPPRLALPPPVTAPLPMFTFGQQHRSNMSFQDVSDDPLFLFTDLFEDSSDESVNNNLNIAIQGPGLVSSQCTVQNASTETVPSTGTVAKLFPSNTTVASDVVTTSTGGQQPLDQPDNQDHQQDQQDQHDRQEQLEFQDQHEQAQLQDQQVSSTTSDPTSETKVARSRSPLHDEPDAYEPKYSRSSSSLD